ncbi:hypothetical protein ACN38_g6686 [Penicillium nordicum]|uniref:Uncharacterized protein n=1 Tax=Penicillium nordicum TaxID=229535 RepID=A0A0M8P885_9EURO|nr:hypothetical protein ACN38_g6686 [Penicillium nordicum]
MVSLSLSLSLSIHIVVHLMLYSWNKSKMLLGIMLMSVIISWTTSTPSFLSRPQFSDSQFVSGPGTPD